MAAGIVARTSGKAKVMFYARFVVAAGALASSLMLMSSALAEERVCRGTIRAVTLDNVLVPQNATCKLLGTRVKGNIVVKRNATLIADSVVVVGNVQAENALLVEVIDNSRVGGSVQVKQGDSAKVADSKVDADIQFESNDGPLSILRNTVGGNVQVFQNSGGVTIRRNVIDGNLQCKENKPAPQGGKNVVQGNKEDQCAKL